MSCLIDPYDIVVMYEARQEIHTWTPLKRYDVLHNYLKYPDDQIDRFQ